MSGLYQSGWSPPGARRSWDRTSMDAAGSDAVLRRHSSPDNGVPYESVGWFDDDGYLRLLICDYPNGRRVILRKRARDNCLTLTRTPAEHLPARLSPTPLTATIIGGSHE